MFSGLPLRQSVLQRRYLLKKVYLHYYYYGAAIYKAVQRLIYGPGDRAIGDFPEWTRHFFFP
jgi:hypothetical protein